MSLDGKLLYQAKTRLDERREELQARQNRRLEEAYGRNPKLREIDRRLRGTVVDVIYSAIRGGEDPVSAVEAAREENLLLQEERVAALLDCGLPADFLDDHYACTKCHDTGYNGTEICTCLMELYREEQRKELSALLKIGRETFDSFDLDYYDDEPDRETGVSPRENMEIVYETCVEYARKFGKNSTNLFMRGGTGLGKTFLSTCIAKVVSENGYSVVYDTASSVFSKFEAEKFSRDGDMEEKRRETNRILSCDLLILDDLGTEMPSAFITSCLYTLVNTRLLSGKKTIISTNLRREEMRRRYSEQIMSRLEGEYKLLPFYGRDIRRLRNDRG